MINFPQRNWTDYGGEVNESPFARLNTTAQPLPGSSQHCTFTAGGRAGLRLSLHPFRAECDGHHTQTLGLTLTTTRLSRRPP